MKGRKNDLKVVQSEDDFLAGWIQVESQLRSSTLDTITVAFTSPNPKTGFRAATIRIGFDILKEMGWKPDERIGVYFHPDDNYKWLICPAAKGYKLQMEANNKVAMKVQMIWRKPGIDWTKAQTVQFEKHTKHITFSVPNNLVVPEVQVY
jgi:hypothetical protein